MHAFAPETTKQKERTLKNMMPLLQTYMQLFKYRRQSLSEDWRKGPKSCDCLGDAVAVKE
jgi:hypothetical protein